MKRSRHLLSGAASPVGLALVMSLGLIAPPSSAANADVSSVPLSSTVTTTAKPNIMFVLDNSGSMAWDFMPDDIDTFDGFDGAAGNIWGYRSSQCNGVYFNPNLNYDPPVTAGGVAFTAPAWPNAWNDGFNTSSGSVDVSSAVYNTYSGTQPAMNWIYTTSGVTRNTFFNECTTSRGSASGVFTERQVSAQTADIKARFVRWYSYYRTRQLTMRTAAGLAFKDLDSNFRVGFTPISETAVSGNRFLNVSDFVDVTGKPQRTNFYDKLYTTETSGGTPLRGALSKVGRYYANAINGQTDPIQYSCQRNYALLSTDGYWNRSNSGSPGYEDFSTYGPLTVSNTMVGEQDGAGQEDRPMRDGSTASYTITRTTVIRGKNRTATTPFQWTRTTRNIFGSCRRQVCSLAGSSYSRSQVFDLTTTQKTVETFVNDTSTGAPSSVSGYPQDSVGNLISTTPTSPPTGPSCGTGANWNNIGQSFNCSASVSAAWVASTTVNSDAGGTTETQPEVRSATTVTGGDSNSLADVAEYYYKTDLRSNLANDVPASGLDTARHQHMTTFTLGLGARGVLAYDRNYLTQTSGDFYDITRGTKNWPVPTGTTSTDSGGDATHIDDLWHAAVNGRGQYFSASDPSSLADAISTSLTAITKASGSGAAAAASTLTPVTGDDWVLLPSYTSVDWTGDLKAYKFTFVNGELVAPDTTVQTPKWSAKTRLDARTTARRILANGGTGLVAFAYANLPAPAQAYFDNRCTRTATADNLSQCSTLDATTVRPKVTGTNLVSYLAGSKLLYRNATDPLNRVFRTRASLLGDFVNASPVYVGKPPFKYADAGYSSFVTSQSARKKMAYAASNDGMLHAFEVGATDTDAAGGNELWAYVPTAVMPEMWRLASDDYAEGHRYFVDATPIVADVYDGTQWRSILVGGLGAGGKAYYALDVTNPDSPSLLWEYTDANLGLTYSNPVVTKDATGTWVVAFTSGINNVGDGVGRLHILNAVTGALIRSVSTGAGDTTTPSNLGRLNAWVADDTDNTALLFYAGDMLGNLWRFDHDDRKLPAGREAVLLGIAQNAAGTRQPIYGKPVLSEKTVAGIPMALVSFGTGRLLGLSDLSDTTEQTIYTVKDNWGATGLGVLRTTATANLVEQTLDTSRRVPSANLQAVDWQTQNGWFVDLDVGAPNKERTYLDGVPLTSGVIAFASTIPTADACSQGGISYLYQFDMSSGNVVGLNAYTNMIVGLSRVMSSSGKVSAIVTTQDQKTTLNDSGGGTTLPGNSVKRSSWRELMD